MALRAATTGTRKHLHSAEEIAHAARVDVVEQFTQGRRAGNGVRPHGIYIAIASLAVLAVFIGIIAAASSMA